ncbi:type VI secretion system contractile sheath large subunit [Escherichia coli]|nr:type VI secretion system contractile sheath large subunit [Escherichia coli]
MSLQEEELVSSHAGQPEQASSLLDQIMAQTRIQPGSEGYDVARQGVTAFIASILQSTASAEPVNKLAVDSMIADIDERISRQMDVIIHAPAFQQVESFWRSLKTMVDRVDFRENIKVNVLHVTKQELLEDFEFAPEIIQSGFYKHVYSSGFGQFGGEPIAAVLGAYEFKNTAPDMKLLQYVSAVGAMAHAPFLSSVSPEFMGLNSWTELPNIKDLYAIFEGPAYTKWRALRDSEDSRYLGLTAPRFLLRQPYSPTDNPVKNFNYYEDVSQNHEDYLWGKPVDKSSLLLAKALSDNEKMAICEFILYRTSKAGIYQPYYKINLSKARISSIDFVTPHAVLEKELEPQERIAFIYEDISWEHTLAGTNAMSKWQDRVQ